MLWGQFIKVVTYHKNLMQEAFRLTSDCVLYWCLLLKEYGPEITYIKGVDNTVADALSRIKYDPSKHVKDLLMHTGFFHMATLLNQYNQKQPGGQGVLYRAHSHRFPVG